MPSTIRSTRATAPKRIQPYSRSQLRELPSRYAPTANTRGTEPTRLTAQKQLAIRERVLLNGQAKAKVRSEAARVRKETTFAQALRSNKEFPQLGASRTSIAADEELGPTPPSPPKQTALTASTDQPNMDILLAILQRMDSVVAEVNNMRTEMNSLNTELLIIKRAKTATTVNG
ncbi:unnamed protein product [Parnassius apollo]|uniref:(apollo) hypothetical protein n=1 Tax=Parnassius apollo TaxID=110799 RepID=A0A8S3XUZ6_PARAO|nr:unnamed protein product [Parnassius apollo]